MKCPKCGFNSFESLDSCKKCGNNLVNFKQAHGVLALVLPTSAAAETAAAHEAAPVEALADDALGSETFSWEAPEQPTAALQPPVAGRYVDFTVDLPPEESADAVAEASPLMGEEAEDPAFAEFSFDETVDQEFVASDEAGSSGEFSLEDFLDQETPAVPATATIADGKEISFNEFDALFQEAEAEPKKNAS
jgi:hypothetical protein